MDSITIYQTVYHILNKSTPLRIDCGRLCNRACCNGTNPGMIPGETMGMYLFPGEELVLRDVTFLEIKPLELESHPQRKMFLATCNAECDRHQRPLACRIFPLTPYLTGKDILTVKIDPRAAAICPLAKDLQRYELQPQFIQNVRKVCNLLISNPVLKNYIKDLSGIIDEYTSLFDLLDKKSFYSRRPN